MAALVFRDARLVFEDRVEEGDLLVRGPRIERIGPAIEAPEADEIDAGGFFLMPGLIDDQVHFREPGLTHKATIATESRAAAAGGVTSFMDMPNVVPPSLTRKLLEERYAIAARDSAVNYAFYMGASNDNLDEVRRTDPSTVCGVKVFMGSSTGDMLVDEEKALEGVFAEAPMLVAVHCEDEARIRERSTIWRARYGEEVPMACHAEIRDEKACLRSSSKAVALARRHGTRLHVLHISTTEELDLFEPGPPGAKRVTAEACVHHLRFDSGDYGRLGARIKCNPAIKHPRHKRALLDALLDDRLDVVATDHAPHTSGEKTGTYFRVPSGLPLVQHSLNVLLEFVREGRIDLPFVARKTAAAVADCFGIRDRGRLAEGQYADCFLLDPETVWTVGPENILAKCGWSPFEGETFRGRVLRTWVNGREVWGEGGIVPGVRGERLAFAR